MDATPASSFPGFFLLSSSACDSSVVKAKIVLWIAVKSSWSPGRAKGGTEGGSPGGGVREGMSRGLPPQKPSPDWDDGSLPRGVLQDDGHKGQQDPAQEEADCSSPLGMCVYGVERGERIKGPVVLVNRCGDTELTPLQFVPCRKEVSCGK